jgi:glycosyltransferase involved in cell wall biosynthesis
MHVAKQKMNLDISKNYVLFGSSFDNPIKNSELAIRAFNTAKERLSMDLEFLELKNFSREEVSSLLNASCCLVMTSFSEGSPQVIKEALATNRPIVSTAVGSVSELIHEVKGCALVDQKLESVADGIEKCIIYSIKHGATEGRDHIQDKWLDVQQVASSIHCLYRSAVSTTSFT